MKNPSANRLKWGAVCGLAVVGMVVLACSGKPRPKSTIMDLFTALHANDTSLVRQNIDFDRAWVSVQDELGEPGDSLMAEIPWGERLYNSLTGEGDLRRRWMKTQVVINKTYFFGDSATVEVSFIDRESGIHFYNRMALIYKGDRWVIVAFRTL